MSYNSATNSIEYGNTTLDAISLIPALGNPGQALIVNPAGDGMIFGAGGSTGTSVDSLTSSDGTITVTGSTATNIVINHGATASWTAQNSYTQDTYFDKSVRLTGSSTTNVIQLANATTGVAAGDGSLIYMDATALHINNQEGGALSEIKIQLANDTRIHINDTASVMNSPDGATRLTTTNNGTLFEVNAITRQASDSISTRIYSPDGSTGIITVSDTEISSTYNAALRTRVNANSTELLSPNGNYTTNISNTGIVLYDGAFPRVNVSSTNTSILSPDATNTLIVSDSSITVNNGAFVVTVPIASTDTLANLAGVQSFSNKTATSSTNDITARSVMIGSGSGVVSCYASAAPTVGQTLVATSATTMTFQTPASSNSWTAAMKAAFLYMPYSNIASFNPAGIVNARSNGLGKVIFSADNFTMRASNKYALSTVGEVCNTSGGGTSFLKNFKNNYVFNTGLNYWIASSNANSGSNNIAYIADNGLGTLAWTSAATVPAAIAGWANLCYSPTLARTVCINNTTTTASFMWADDASIGVWTAGTGITILPMNNICWCTSANMFIASGDAATGLIYYSDAAGKVWAVAGVQPTIGAVKINGIAWSNSLNLGVLVTAGTSSGNLQSFTITGTTFAYTTRTVPTVFGAIGLSDVIFCSDISNTGLGPEVWVCSTSTITSALPHIFSSSDGVNWSPNPSTAVNTNPTNRLTYCPEFRSVIGISSASALCNAFACMDTTF